VCIRQFSKNPEMLKTENDKDKINEKNKSSRIARRVCYNKVIRIIKSISKDQVHFNHHIVVASGTN